MPYPLHVPTALGPPPEKEKPAPRGFWTRSGELGFDFVKDQLFGEVADRVAAKAGLILEAPTTGRLSRVLGRGASAPAAAFLELGKASYLAGNREARKGHDEAGVELEKEPGWYQAGNLLLSPADAFSKYGAAMETRGKVAFEREHQLSPGVLAAVKRQRDEVQQAQAEQAASEAAKRSLEAVAPSSRLSRRTPLQLDRGRPLAFPPSLSR